MQGTATMMVGLTLSEIGMIPLLFEFYNHCELFDYRNTA